MSGTIETAGRVVEVLLPADPKVTTHLMVTAGPIESEFDLGSRNQALLIKAGGPRTIAAMINGGGPSLQITAHTILLRKTLK